MNQLLKSGVMGKPGGGTVAKSHWRTVWLGCTGCCCWRCQHSACVFNGDICFSLIFARRKCKQFLLVVSRSCQRRVRSLELIKAHTRELRGWVVTKYNEFHFHLLFHFATLFQVLWEVFSDLQDLLGFHLHSFTPESIIPPCTLIVFLISYV